MQATSSVFWIIKVACGAYIVVCTRLMGSKSSRWSVTWVVLFICLLLCFSAKAIATRNLAGYADEKGPSRRLLGRSPCKRGRMTSEVVQGDRKQQREDSPRCNNYL
ncbi:hypothetical protein AAZX31_12G007100 [Glycine max]